MQYKFFRVPVVDPEPFQEELNAFLGSKRVIAIKDFFVSEGNESFWAIQVEYLRSAKKTDERRRGNIDYKEVLSAVDFALFSALRELRKSIADEEGVPVYALFTNEQLAEMVRRKVKTKTDMKSIEGIGNSKMEKYSEKFLEKINGMLE